MAQKSVPTLQCPDGSVTQEFKHVGRSEMLHWAGRKKAPIIPMFYVYFHGILHIFSTHIIPFSCAKPMAGASQLLRRGPTLVATAVVSWRLAVRRQGLRRCAAVAVLGTEQVLCPALSGEGWMGDGWDGWDGWDGPGWANTFW